MVENNERLKQSPTFISTGKTQWNHFITQRMFFCIDLCTLARAPHCPASVHPHLCHFPNHRAPDPHLLSVGHWCHLCHISPSLAESGPIRKQRNLFQKLGCSHIPRRSPHYIMTRCLDTTEPSVGPYLSQEPLCVVQKALTRAVSEPQLCHHLLVLIRAITMH